MGAIFRPGTSSSSAKGDLHAVPFDPRTRRLGGEPVLVLPSVAVDELTGAAFFDVSEDGALFYVAAESELSRPATLLGVDRNGVATPIGAPSPSLQVPRWSPDGRFVLTTVQSNDATDVWSLQVGRGNLTRLTFDGRSAAAVWTPDGRRVAYNSSREGRQAIYWKAADGSGEADVLTDGAGPLFPTSFSPDGETLAFTELNADTGFDIWLLSLEGRESTPFLASQYSEAGAQFSPDGRLVAYTSDESGRDEVYVRAFAGSTRRWQISTESGSEPMWSRDGTELFYRVGTKLMVVPVTSSPSFTPGSPRELFDVPVDEAGSLYANYDIRPDGRQFVMIRSENGSAAGRIHVVLHWLDELARRVPVR